MEIPVMSRDEIFGSKMCDLHSIIVGVVCDHIGEYLVMGTAEILSLKVWMIDEQEYNQQTFESRLSEFIGEDYLEEYKVNN